MYTEIASLTRCCFCAPLRYGIIVWAYSKLVFNILVFAIGLFIIAGFGIIMFYSEYATYILLLFTSVLLLFFCDILFNIALIVGIHKRRTRALYIYMQFGIAHATLFVIVTLMIFAFLLATTPEIHRADTLHIFVTFLSICSSFIILQMYLLLLVHSEILKLKTNGQFQFVNHNSEPECIMQVDSSSTVKEREIIT